MTLSFGIFCAVCFMLLDRSYYDGDVFYCQATMPLWGYMSNMLWDTIISLLLLYLYVRKLNKMKKIIEHKNDAINTEIINKVAIKGVICVSFAVVTSFVCIVMFVIKGNSIVILVDSIGNFLC